MTSEDRRLILRKRICDLLVGDQEYLEEIFLHANFNLDWTSPSAQATALRVHFRLDEVLRELLCIV